MLTRRHIRVKVMQSIYALKHSEEETLDKQEVFLQKSMGNMYSLYLSLLSLFMEIREMDLDQVSIASKKYIQDEKPPYTNPQKLSENRILRSLANDEALKEVLEKRKLKIWYLNPEYVKILYREITSSSSFKKYMSSTQSDFEEDREFILSIFKNFIAPNEKLHDFLEDNQITWMDDLPIVNTFLLKRIKKINSEDESLFVEMRVDKEDVDFSIRLLRKTALNSEELTKEFSDKTPNWDQERIADIDTILLQMAICEFLYFPSIPVRVTLNEYLEIAKEYSSPKSSIFINGILDAVSNELKKSERLLKKGRGLL